MTREYLVVDRNDGTTDVFLTEPGKGFRLFDVDGRLTDTVRGYSDAIRGWTRMRFRSNLAEAMDEVGVLVPCPGCGGHRLLCRSEPSKHNIQPPSEGWSAFVECTDCGRSVGGVTIRDARMRWNSECGRSIETSEV